MVSFDLFLECFFELVLDLRVRAYSLSSWSLLSESVRVAKLSLSFFPPARPATELTALDAHPATLIRFTAFSFSFSLSDPPLSARFRDARDAGREGGLLPDAEGLRERLFLPASRMDPSESEFPADSATLFWQRLRFSFSVALDDGAESLVREKICVGLPLRGTSARSTASLTRRVQVNGGTIWYSQTHSLTQFDLTFCKTSTYCCAKLSSMSRKTVRS